MITHLVRCYDPHQKVYSQAPLDIEDEPAYWMASLRGSVQRVWYSYQKAGGRPKTAVWIAVDIRNTERRAPV